MLRQVGELTRLSFRHATICSNNRLLSLVKKSPLIANFPAAPLATKLADITTTSRFYSSPAIKNHDDGEIVQFVTLNNISDNPGAVKKKRRVGRGIGSSKGKTCGRGHKGQNSRSGGGVRPTFEGGQTPLFKRIPKRGFNNKRFGENMIAINVGTLQDYVDMGRLPVQKDDGQALTMKDLLDAGVCGSSFSLIKSHGMKLLADGKERLRSPIKLEIARASRSAIEALEAVGGSVTTVHYNRLALRVLMKPKRYENKIVPKQAKPPPKRLSYYTSYDNRGYLSLEKQLENKLKLSIDSVLGSTKNQST